MKRLMVWSLVLGLAPAVGVGSRIVDEVVAVVGETPLLRSDIELATAVGLIAPRPDETSDELRRRTVEARVRLEVQYRDLEASGILYRLRPDLGTIRQTFIDRLGGAERLAAVLDATGMAAADLDDLALRVAAVDAYVEERLRPRVSVTRDELEREYRETVVAEMERRGEPAPPLVELRDQLRQLVVERKLNDEIERWLAQARERLDVTVFAP
jgi:hypothetical protein